MDEIGKPFRTASCKDYFYLIAGRIILNPKQDISPYTCCEFLRFIF